MADDLAGAIIGAVIYAAAAGLEAAVTNEASSNARRKKRHKRNNNNWTTDQRDQHAKGKPMRKNLFAAEDLKPTAVQAFPGTTYDRTKLRGKLVHKPIPSNWKYQPTFIIHSGFMHKTGEINTSFKTRFFVLTSKREIRYYKCSEHQVEKIASKEYLRKTADQFLKGIIKLRNFQSIEVRSKKEFRLKNADSLGRDFTLRCDNPVDSKVWNLLIRAAVAGEEKPWVAVNAAKAPAHIVRTGGDEERIDDIDPIMPEVVDADYHLGPGYDPEPSAPEVVGERMIDEPFDLAPSAPPAEFGFCPGEPEHGQIEGMRTGG